MSLYEIADGTRLLTTDPAKLDLRMVHHVLTRSYWSPGIAFHTVQRGVEHSIPFGVLENGQHVAFARVISDRTTFAYLADVFVLEEFRGRGIGSWMMAGILAHPELRGLRTWLLATRDAHRLYGKHGFVPLPNPDRWMRFPAEPDHESARRIAAEVEAD